MKRRVRQKEIFGRPKPKRRVILSVLTLVVILAVAATAIGWAYHERNASQSETPASSDQLTVGTKKTEGAGADGQGQPKDQEDSGAPGDVSSSPKGKEPTAASISAISAPVSPSDADLSASLPDPAAASTPPAVAPQTAGESTMPEKEAVSNDYFDDAVFVGDSRTQGLMLYAGLKHAVFYANKGLNVNEVFDKNLAVVKGRKVSIAAALSQTSYSKVYIMLGINELGWVYPEKFYDQYAKMIDTIQSTHPDAVIYLEGLMPVTDAKSAKDLITNNKNIDRFNVLIAQLAEDKKINYLNVREAVQDENGNLCDEATTDGVHLNKVYCLKWLDYLKTHTI